MSLQIRRGTDAQRQTVTFDLGEIVYTTDTQKLYVGDGVTSGGNNILASAAGSGLSWNSSTQTLNFSGVGLSLTTDLVSEGVGAGRQYFTTARAQAAAAAMFTAVGSPVVAGTITATTAGTPSIVTVGSNVGLVALEPFVVTGNTGGTGGLTNGTYYIVNPAAGTNQITLASSLANAQAGTAIASLTTASLSATNFSAGGGDSNITFTYNQSAGTMSASVSLNATGILSVSQDTSPSLGGNLGLNSYNITGNGNINITGGITNTGTLSNTGTISNTGNITSTGTVTGGSLATSNFLVSGNTVTATTNVLNLGSTTSPLTQLTINSTGANTVPVKLYGITGTFTGAFQGAFISKLSSRGTAASPTAISAGDIISGDLSSGYQGSAYGIAGVTGFQADPTGTISSSSNFIKGVWFTSVSNGTTVDLNNNVASFNSYGVFASPIFQPIAKTSTQISALTPSAGWTVFNSTTQKLQVYVSDTGLAGGGASNSTPGWVNLY